MGTRTTPLKGPLSGLASVIIATVLIGCATYVPPPEVGPYAELHESARIYIDKLRDQDRLPGFHKGEHGALTSIPEPVWDKGIAYPAYVIFEGNKEGSDSLYRYTLLKRDPEAEWKLVEAARFDKNSRIAEQLYLPK